MVGKFLGEMPKSAARTPVRQVAAVVVAAVMLPGPAAARAAEIVLRPECRSRGPVVTLGDVAEVSAADSAQAGALKAIELCPAPAPGAKRFLRPRQIQDLLLGRGVNLLEHRLSGSSQVVVVGAAASDAAEAPTDRRPLALGDVKRAEELVAKAVEVYLQRQVSGGIRARQTPVAQPSPLSEETDADTFPSDRRDVDGRDADRRHAGTMSPWRVEVKLADAHARLVAASDGQVSVRGGAAPWVGGQRFQATLGSPDGPVRFDFEAQVTRLPSLVVAARPLARGTVICAGDVRLAPSEPIAATAGAFQSLDEVIGRQTTQAIAEGKVLGPDAVRPPLLVRRGDTVIVYARGAGVCVRSRAKAREDGALGDLIEVESPGDRAAYFARVSGPQQVEVYARPTQAGGAPRPPLAAPES